MATSQGTRSLLVRHRSGACVLEIHGGACFGGALLEKRKGFRHKCPLGVPSIYSNAFYLTKRLGFVIFWSEFTGFWASRAENRGGTSGRLFFDKFF